MNTIILVIVVWLANGEVRQEAIHAPSIVACNKNASDIVADMMKLHKGSKIVKEKHVCMEFV